MNPWDDFIPWYWLSFCDPSAEVGSRFIGVAVVRARDIHYAAQVAWSAGCNPGGEAAGLSIPAEHGDPPARYTYRLLSRDECSEMLQLWIGNPELSPMADVADECEWS